MGMCEARKQFIQAENLPEGKEGKEIVTEITVSRTRFSSNV